MGSSIETRALRTSRSIVNLDFGGDVFHEFDDGHLIDIGFFEGIDYFAYKLLEKRVVDLLGIG